MDLDGLTKAIKRVRARNFSAHAPCFEKRFFCGLKKEKEASAECQNTVW